MLEHLLQRLPEQFQVIFAKAGLLGEEGRHKAVGHVDAVGHGVLAAHGAVVALLLFGLGFGGNGHAGDGVLLGDDGFDRAGKGQLHRAAHLTAVVPVDMTAPKVRTSKKFWHIHLRALSTSSALPLRFSLAGFFFLA
jgi:hypothetical protein